jgi:DNA-binding transcriptional ArsR family regulator
MSFDAISLVSDDVMRPWTQDALLDEKILKSVKLLDDTIVEMSPQAAVRGRSVLDNKPEEVQELERIANANPLGWIDAMLTGLTEEEYSALAAHLEAEREGGNQEEGEEGRGENEGGIKIDNERMAALSQQNKLLMRTIMQLNAALKKQGEKEKKEPKQLKQFFRLTGTKNQRKPTLSSIKYKPRPGPAVFNMSTAEFKRFFERQGISIEVTFYFIPFLNPSSTSPHNIPSSIYLYLLLPCDLDVSKGN